MDLKNTLIELKSLKVGSKDLGKYEITIIGTVNISDDICYLTDDDGEMVKLSANLGEILTAGGGVVVELEVRLKNLSNKRWEKNSILLALRGHI